MEIVKHTCTLGQAQKLNDLGLKAHSLYKWGYSLKQNKHIIQWYTVDNLTDCYNAYTVSELGEILPFEWYSFRTLDNIWNVYNALEIVGETTDIWDIEASTEAQVRAALLIHLLENKHVTLDEVNK